MDERRERSAAWMLILLFLLVISLPYLLAFGQSAPGYTFGGFLLNPIDGNSYLAKMRQGVEGAWSFTLPYTAEPGEGAAINLYYLFLGHVSRVFGMSLILVYHVARVFAALLLALALRRLFARLFDHSGTRLLALGLALFGSGLGWLALAFGGFTSDFWVAEAYPFLASYVNPHFALGLALQVWLMMPLKPGANPSWQSLALTVVLAALLSMIYPFGWAVAAALRSAWLAWLSWQRAARRSDLSHWLAILLGGAPYALYAYLVIHSHPVLALWDAQNLTPSPGLVDLIIALSPALALATWGAWVALRQKNTAALFAIWLLAGILLIYLPFNWQRRLISGLYVPVSGLAAFAIMQLNLAVRWKSRIAAALIILSLPTNAIVVVGGIRAVSTNASAFVLHTSEIAAFRFLDETEPKYLLGLASPQTGNFLPAYALVRVIYGHPYETVHADLRSAEVLDFYSGRLTEEEALAYLQNRGVDFIFYGPSERELGNLPTITGWQAVYEETEVVILARDH